MIFRKLTFLAHLIVSCQGYESPWGYKCEGSVCKKDLKSNEFSLSLETCTLICPAGNSLWPLPKTFTMDSSLSRVHPKTISFLAVETNHGPEWVTERLHRAVNRQVELLLLKSSGDTSPSSEDLPLDIRIHIVEGTDEYSLETDESYSLKISRTSTKVQADINAQTFLGGRHAVESLFQLIDFDRDQHLFWIVDNADISDAPYYPHRGFMLDTGHNFVPVSEIKKILESLSYSKMNVFHWHISDSQSFPLVLDSYPQLVPFSTFREDMVYTKDEVRDIVEFAKDRGIIVIPEVEVPAHVGSWWQMLDPDLIVCMESSNKRCVLPPCGQLNPANENVYNVLENIYSELVDLFGDKYLHMGGNQIDPSCWNSLGKTIEWKNATIDTRDYISSWHYFQENALNRLDKVSSNPPEVFLYTSQLTWPENIGRLDNSRYTVQVWSNALDGADSGSGRTIRAVAEGGFKMVMSNLDSTFLDCGFGSGIGYDGSNWCQNFRGWKQAYENNPRRILEMMQVAGWETLANNIVGGETTLLTEQTDIKGIMPKIEPRTAAYAETLWRNPWGDVNHADAAADRMIRHRERLMERGIQAEQITQRWCITNPSLPCSDK